MFYTMYGNVFRCVLSGTGRTHIVRLGLNACVVWFWVVQAACGQPHVIFLGRPVSAIAFTPDGTIFCATDNEIQVRQRDGSPTKRVLKGHTKKIFSLDAHPKMNLLVSGGVDGMIRLWDLTGAKDNKDIKSKPLYAGDVVFAVRFSPSGDFLAAATTEGLHVWKKQGHEWIQARLAAKDIPVEDDFPVSIAFRPKSHEVAAGYRYGRVRVWDLQTNRVVKTLEPHRADSTVVPICFSPDGKLLASAALEPEEKRIVVTDVEKGKRRYKIKARATALAFVGRNGELLAAGTENGGIKYWERKNRFALTDVGTGRPHLKSVTSIWQRGNQLVSASDDGGIIFLDIPTIR